MTPLETVSVLCGLLLILWTYLDVLQTVLVIGGGAGVQSRRLGDGLWRLSLRLHDPSSERSHSLMRATGPLIVLCVLALWVFELTLGWALVFVPEAFAVPAGVDFLDRLQFATRTVIGRAGNAPSLEVAGNGWESVHGIAGLTGVVIVSVGLAYVLPLLSSVAHKRSVATTVHTLAETLEGMRDAGLSRRSSPVEHHLVTLMPAISLTTERHRAYPVLHYFHAHERPPALAPAMARLVPLLRAELRAVQGPDGPGLDPAVVRPVSRTIASLAEALCQLGVERYALERPEVETPPDPSIDGTPGFDAVDAGLPSDEWMRAYVRYDGWNPQED